MTKYNNLKQEAKKVGDILNIRRPRVFDNFAVESFAPSFIA